jgi:hypothetical protein
MRKRVYITLAVLLVILAGVSMWQELRQREREPEYQGKGLRTWLSEARWESNWEARGRAEAAIRHIGTNAIPKLLEMLRQKDSPLTSKLIPWWGRHIAERPHLPSFIRFPHWYRNNAQIPNSDWSSTVRMLSEDKFSRNAGFFMHVNCATSKWSGKF